MRASTVMAMLMKALLLNLSATANAQATEYRMLVLANYALTKMPWNRGGLALEYWFAGLGLGARKYIDEQNKTGNNVSVKFKLVDVGSSIPALPSIIQKAVEDFQPCWVEGVYHGTSEQTMIAGMIAAHHNVFFNVVNDLTGKAVVDTQRYYTAVSMMPSSLFYFMRNTFKVSAIYGWKRVAVLLPIGATDIIPEYDQQAKAVGLSVRFLSVDTDGVNAENEITRALQVVQKEKYSIIGCALPRLSDTLRTHMYMSAIDLGLAQRGVQWFFNQEKPDKEITFGNNIIDDHFRYSIDFSMSNAWPQVDAEYPEKWGEATERNMGTWFAAIAEVGAFMATLPFKDWDLEGVNQDNCTANDFMCKTAVWALPPATLESGISNPFFMFAALAGAMSARTEQYLMMMSQVEAQGLCGAAALNDPTAAAKLKDVMKQFAVYHPIQAHVAFDCVTAEDGSCTTNMFRKFAVGVKQVGILYENNRFGFNAREVGWFSPAGVYHDIDSLMRMPVNEAMQVLDNRSYRLWQGHSPVKPKDVLVDTCGPRHYVNETTADCMPCPRGTGNPLDTSNNCSIPMADDCDPGLAWSWQRLACEPCPKGTAKNTKGQEACTPCPVGTYASQTGSLQCAACPPGSVAPSNSTQLCESCDRGFYTNLDDRSKCHPCSDKRTTAEMSSPSVDSCRCDVHLLQLSDGQCEACNTMAATCPGVMWDSNITSKPGFMLLPAGASGRRLAASQYAEMPESFACISKEDCPGDAKPGQCPEGHTGVACAECEAGFARSGGKACLPCSSDGGREALFFVAMLLALVVVCAGVLVAGSARISIDLKAGAAVSQAAGLLVTYLQLNSLMSSVAVEWPSVLTSVFDSIGILSMEPDSVSITCTLGTLGNSATILQKFIVLMLAYLLTVMLWQLQRVVTSRMPNVKTCTLANLCNCLGLISTIAFIPISLNGFSVLNCFPHPDGGSSMTALPGLLCFSDRWFSEAFGAGLVCGLFAIALFCGLVFLTYLSPRVKSFEAVVFLVARFQPDKYYWLVVLSLRNLLLTVAPIFSSNPFIVNSVMTLVLCTYLVALCLTTPWRFRHHNTLDVILTMALLMTVVEGNPFCAAATLPLATDKDSAEWAVLSFFVSAPLFLAFAGALVSMAVGVHRLMKDAATKPQRLAKFCEDLSKSSKDIAGILAKAETQADLLDALNNNLQVLNGTYLQKISTGSRLAQQLVLGVDQGADARHVLMAKPMDLTLMAGPDTYQEKVREEATCSV